MVEDCYDVDSSNFQTITCFHSTTQGLEIVMMWIHLTFRLFIYLSSRAREVTTKSKYEGTNILCTIWRSEDDDEGLENVNRLCHHTRNQSRVEGTGKPVARQKGK